MTRKELALAAALTALVLFVIPAAASSHDGETHDDALFEMNDVRVLNKRLATGAGFPIALEPLDQSRFLVGYYHGEVKILDRSDDSLTELLDLSADTHAVWDRSLSSVTLDPGFHDPDSTGHRRAYALYGSVRGTADGTGPELPPGSCPTGWYDCVSFGELVSFEIEPDLTAGSPELLMRAWCAQSPAHHTGDLVWDGDELLVSSGDGVFTEAYENQPTSPACGPGHGSLRSQMPWLSEDLDGWHLNGAVVRIRRELLDQHIAEADTLTPADITRDDLLAGGLRNPWRMLADPDTESVLVSNVGSHLFEEIDQVPLHSSAPYNSGWPCREGDYVFPFGWDERPECVELEQMAVFSSPLFAYNNSTTFGAPVGTTPKCDLGRSVSALARVPGNWFDTTRDGDLLFTDWVRGCGWTMERRPDGTLDPSSRALFSDELNHVTGLAFEDSGSLLWTSTAPGGYGGGRGSINRLGVGPVAIIGVTGSGNEIAVDASGSETTLDRPDLEYEWSLDGSPWQTGGPELSPAEIAGVDQVRLRVTDGLGRTDTTTLTVPRGTPPSLEIQGLPAGDETLVGQKLDLAALIEGEDTADFALEWNVTIDHCPPAEDCHRHPLTYRLGSTLNLTVPPHEPPSYLVIELSAENATGLRVSRQARLAITVDTTAPDTTIDSGPTGPTSDTTPTFGFSADESATFECRLYEQGTTPPSFRACSGPGDSHTPASALADGDYTFEVRATDAATNAGTATRNFTVDTTPPDTTIDSGPTGTITTDQATFTFSGDPASDTAKIQCRIDSEPFADCSSPKTFTGLSDGPHTAEFRAEDAIGNQDQSPVTAEFTADPPPPDPTPPAAKPRLANLKITPKSKKVRRGKKAAFKVTVKNTGNAAAKKLKVCVKGPKKLVKVPKCLKPGNLAAGRSKTVKFKVKVKKRAKKGKKAKITFTAYAKGAKKKSGKATVKVR